MTIPARLLNRSLSWYAATTATDIYGDSQTTFTGVTPTTITGRIDQARTIEPADATRDLPIADCRLFTNTLTIGPLDVIVDGTTHYEVVGQPWIVDSPRGGHHLEVNLRAAQHPAPGAGG